MYHPAFFGMRGSKVEGIWIVTSGKENVIKTAFWLSDKFKFEFLHDHSRSDDLFTLMIWE